MPGTITRRTFGQRLLAGVAATAIPDGRAPAQSSRRLRIGCTALIWGAVPRTPETLTTAVRDMDGLGFHGFETFASIIHDWDAKGTLAPLLAAHRIPLISGYATVQLTDAAARKDNLAQVIQWGRALKKHGGTFMVLAPNG